MGTLKNKNNSDEIFVVFGKINTEPLMFDHHNSPLSCKLKRLFRSNYKGHCIYTFDDIMASLVAADLKLLGFTVYNPSGDFSVI